MTRTEGSIVLLIPQLRNVEVERLIRAGPPASYRVVYWDQKSDCEPALVRRAGAVRLGNRASLRALVQPSVEVVETPEPFWFRYWIRAASLVSVAAVVRWMRRIPRLSVQTYAIENLSPRERLEWRGLSGANRYAAIAGGSLVRALTRMSANRLIDVVAYGTDAARGNYRDHGVLRGASALVVPESLALCEECFPGGQISPVWERPKRVLFVGELSERKGVNTLLSAWSRGRPGSDWELVLCGEGPLEDDVARATLADPSIRHIRADRMQVHDLFRDARIVVLASQRVPRWREQVGLPALEAEAHGCSLVISSESGIATHMDGRRGVQIVRPRQQEALEGAIQAAAASGTGMEPCPVDGKNVARDWMQARRA